MMEEDAVDGEAGEQRRSGRDRRRHRFLPELSEQHRALLYSAALITATWLVATWYHDVIGLPNELIVLKEEMKADVTELSGKVDTLGGTVGEVSTKVSDLNTEVRILKETGFSSQDATKLTDAVNRLSVVVESFDSRLRRLEENQ